MVGEQLVLPKYQETAYTNGHYAADHATNGRHPTTEDRPDDGDEESALLSAAAPKSDGLLGKPAEAPFVHPIGRAKRYYMVFIYCAVASLLSADQNLMAPNLTAIQKDFGFSDQQKDQLLGGWVAAAFFLVGAPSALTVGALCNSCNRRNLLFIVVILGEAPCIAMYWVTRYWQLLVLRLLTGLSLGAILPLILSLLGDLFSGGHRSAVAAFIQVAVGAGGGLGQAIAGFVGPYAGWRLPFVIVAVPTLLLAVLMLLTAEEPPRGVTEAALQSQYAADDYLYEEKLDWAKLRKLFRIQTNVYNIMQGLPGCPPWGMFLTFFNDFLSQQKGLSVPVATMVMMVWGLGGGVGVVGGGYVGQWIYNRTPERMPLVAGCITAASVFPMWWVVNAKLDSSYGVAAAVACVFVGGLTASVAGPNIKAMLMNVNEPETRGVALALHVVLDDLGKGFGPALVALLITALGRQAAFTLSVAGWLPCGALIACASRCLVRDEADMQQRLTSQVALQTFRPAGVSKGAGEERRPLVHAQNGS